MNVEIGTEAAPFPEKKYIYGISLAVYPGGYKDARNRMDAINSRDIINSKKDHSSTWDASISRKTVLKSERNAGYTDIFFVNIKSTNFKYLSKYKKRFKSLKNSGSGCILFCILENK
jgi:hypothetical protein